MSWQIFTAISVISLSISVLLQRILIHKDKIDPYAYGVIFQAIVGVLLTLFALLYGFKLPNIETLLVPAGIALVFFGVGHIVYAKTLQHVEASAFSVLFATQAVWIMALGILLFQENLTIVQIIGTILIFVAVGMLVKNIRTVSIDKGILLGLLTGLLFGIAITAWSYVGRHTDTFSWAAISFIGAALVTFLVKPSTANKMLPLLKGELLAKLTVLAIFYGIGSVTMLLAYTTGTFTLVTPLRQTSIIITVLLALLFLQKERTNIPKKLIAATICFVGVALIVI